MKIAWNKLSYHVSRDNVRPELYADENWFLALCDFFRISFKYQMRTYSFNFKFAPEFGDDAQLYGVCDVRTSKR